MALLWVCQYMPGDWRGTLLTLLVTFCIVIISCTETFWSPILWPTEKFMGEVCMQQLFSSCELHPFNNVILLLLLLLKNKCDSLHPSYDSSSTTSLNCYYKDSFDDSNTETRLSRNLVYKTNHWQKRAQQLRVTHLYNRPWVFVLC
jgi:hypothetical protein